MHARKSRVKQPCSAPQPSGRDVVRVIGVSGMTGDQIIRGYLQ